MSGLIFQSVISADILPGFQTDHLILYVNIDFHEVVCGPGYWKFNTSLLEDKTFVAPSMKQKWELIKLAVRNYTLKYAARKQKSLNNKLNILEKKLKEEEHKLHEVSIFDDSEEQILQLKQDINEIIEYKTKGAVVRCRAD